MKIEEFVESKRAGGKIKSSIAERWDTRVVPRGLHTHGRAGARAYLDSYGRGISVAKIVDLALCAEAHGADEMAREFWEAAFHLETGMAATVEGASMGTPITLPQGVVFSDFPAGLQPGKILPMQPKDAPKSREFYITNPIYRGQPKRDGHKDILFASTFGTAHQSRSLSIMGALDPAFEEAARAAANIAGAFILEGERYFLSASGSG